MGYTRAGDASRLLVGEYPHYCLIKSKDMEDTINKNLEQVAAQGSENNISFSFKAIASKCSDVRLGKPYEYTLEDGSKHAAQKVYLTGYSGKSKSFLEQFKIDPEDDSIVVPFSLAGELHGKKKDELLADSSLHIVNYNDRWIVTSN